MSKYLKKIGLAVVYLGHPNKIYYRLCGLNGRHLFTCSSRGWKFQVEVCLGWVLVRALSGLLKEPFLQWPFLTACAWEKETSGVFSSSCKDTSWIGSGFHPYDLISCFSHVRFFVTLWTVAWQALLSLGFSRHECWSELLCPPPGNLPHPGREPISLMSPALAGGFFTTRATWQASFNLNYSLKGPHLK